MTVPDSEMFAEWLVVNRIGCFAMGTPCRLPQRKYHGLLVSRSNATSEPWHVLAETSEWLRVADQTFELGSFYYDDCIHPLGYLHQTDFEPTPPTWRYRCGATLVARRLRLAEREPAVEIEYTIESSPGQVELDVAPLLTGRCAHHLQFERSGPRVHRHEDGALEVWLPDTPASVHLQSPNGGAHTGETYWNRQVHYPEERRRGYPDREDLYVPARFRWSLRAGERVLLRVSLGPMPPPEAWVETERHAEGGSERTPAPLEHRLEQAASAYVIETGERRASVIAGYPWFGEWGRDTFIALPGLTLARGDHARAAEVLDHFAAHRKDGLIPNVIGPDFDSTNTHSVDATLFFVRAVRAVEEAAGAQFARRWWPTVIELLESLRGSRAVGVQVTNDGLLAADRRPLAMTWMDAIVDGEAVTPRAPLAVEIQALFHDAALYGLRILGRAARGEAWDAGIAKPNETAVPWHEIVSKLERNFLPRFRCGSHLADSVNGARRDTAVRPNQLFALIGARPLVRGTLAKSTLDAVRRSLLTPMGLRTLDPEDPRYRGRCEGTQRERDLAYHQGTVWPWLVGPYLDAVASVEGPKAALEETARVAEGFRGHLDRACWGHVSEIFDGDAPHMARGAPAQAWSVAELLRVLRTYR